MQYIQRKKSEMVVFLKHCKYRSLFPNCRFRCEGMSVQSTCIVQTPVIEQPVHRSDPTPLTDESIISAKGRDRLEIVRDPSLVAHYFFSLFYINLQGLRENKRKRKVY